MASIWFKMERKGRRSGAAWWRKRRHHEAVQLHALKRVAQVHYTKAAATGKVAVAPVIEGGRKTRVGRLGQKA
jgi:hypothetical protein